MEPPPVLYGLSLYLVEFTCMENPIYDMRYCRRERPHTINQPSYK